MRLYRDPTDENKATCNSTPKYFTSFPSFSVLLAIFSELCFALIFHSCHHTIYVRDFLIKFSIDILLGTFPHALHLKCEGQEISSQTARSLSMR